MRSIVVTRTIAAATAVAMATAGPAACANTSVALTTDATRVLDFTGAYCKDCHGSDAQEAGLNLERFQDAQAILQNRELWERALKQVKIGAMPPDYAENPTDEQRGAAVEAMERLVKYVDPSKPIDPGRVTARRLNKKEYDYTIRDLFGVDLDLSTAFPDDGVGYGFDNIGDVLSVSPLHMERYLAAAETLTERLLEAVEGESDEPIDLADITFGGPVRQDDAVTLLSVGGKVSATVSVPLPGQYSVQVAVWHPGKPSGDEGRFGHLQLTVDRQAVGDFPGEVHNRKQARREPAVVKTFLAAGQHEMSVECVGPESAPEVAASDWRIKRTGKAPRGAWPPAARAMLFTQPAEPAAPRESLRRIADAVLPRLWRRPATEEELDRYVGFAARHAADGQDFRGAVAAMVQAALVSPEFLFRVDLVEGPANPGEPATLSPHALAARLSYFLWCSTPDDELLDLARTGQLSNPTVVRDQARRMLDDPRSSRFIEAFFGQWLGLRRLDSLSVDRKLFPKVNSSLRGDMRTETMMFLESIVREDRSLLDLIDADYSYLNNRLAEHYGIPGVEQPGFERVSVDGAGRRGLLTQASVLTLTSYPNRTSPPIRGAWVLENILGDEPPDPPADVPDLQEVIANNPDLPVRQQLAIHRENASCASCHKVMDAIGLGLENYNAVGQWREDEAGVPIDATGDLPSGERFSGAEELIAILKGRDQEFVECVARKMLTFALGRGLEYYDQAAVDKIVAESRESGYRFSTLVQAIAVSRPFTLTRAEGETQP